MNEVPGGQRVRVAAWRMRTLLVTAIGREQSHGGVNQRSVSANRRYLVDQNHVPNTMFRCSGSDQAI
jgi:hypothetical protein